MYVGACGKSETIACTDPGSVCEDRGAKGNTSAAPASFTLAVGACEKCGAAGGKPDADIGHGGIGEAACSHRACDINLFQTLKVDDATHSCIDESGKLLADSMEDDEFEDSG